jgi:hypothetical protein
MFKIQSVWVRCIWNVKKEIRSKLSQEINLSHPILSWVDRDIEGEGT